MAELIVRRLLVDLDAPFGRHWCGGDPFRTALFNALSMSFPVGEQFFIDAVRRGLAALDAGRRRAFEPEARGFIGQEATHRRVHALFNAQLERQGLVNDWEQRAAARLELLQGVDPRHWLAITAANEHFTAILAEWLLRNADLLGDTEPRLRTMWLWHSAEESEHRSTAFDLYRALGGDETWRLRWFRRITVIFVGDTLRQTVANLRRDRTLWQWRTWRSAVAFLFGTRGLVRQTFAPWRAYRRRDFHPDELRSDLSSRWLRDNASAWSAVGASAALSSR
ncbi:MAG: metal-dependent hydrolase [Burkholderiaceae bacterium]|jgi:predicted metal-dependent hydrolase|nr:metal-dependent hydrolase [Burkholderiaceae bacterium]